MCRKLKLTQIILMSANEKADFEILPGYFGLVPTAVLRVAIANVHFTGFVSKHGIV